MSVNTSAEDFGTTIARRHCAEIEAAIAGDREGVLFEDDYVVVERHAGRVFMTGKALKSVLMYGPERV